MKLRIYIKCVDCGEIKEIHILGSWDISSIHHNCAQADYLRGLDRPFKSEAPVGSEWKIEYEPGRSIF